MTLTTAIVVLLAAAALGQTPPPTTQPATAPTTRPTTRPIDRTEVDEEALSVLDEDDPAAPIDEPQDRPTTAPGLPEPPPEPPPEEDPDLWMRTYELARFPDDSRVFWRRGLWFKTGDEIVALKMGGRIQYDFGWVEGTGVRNDTGLGLESHSVLRRNRIYLAGDVGKWIDFKIEFDFAGGGTTLTDAYLRAKKVPVVGNVTAGHFMEPFGLERNTSSNFTMFIERALPNALAPGRGWGVMAHNHAMDRRMTWAVGAFKAWHNTGDLQWGQSDRGNAFGLAGRVTGLPIYQDDGKQFLHLGAAYSLQCPDERIRYRTRPEAQIADVLSNTGRFTAGNVNLIGAEAAWVSGPLIVQGEYMAAAADVNGADNAWLQGFYVQSGYFLTGEQHGYDRRRGIFRGVAPKKNFLTGGGLGAWEVAGRVSFIDLRGGTMVTTANRMTDLTLGLNWYLNPNVRISCNYIRSWLSGSMTSDAADVFLFRLQIAF